MRNAHAELSDDCPQEEGLLVSCSAGVCGGGGRCVLSQTILWVRAATIRPWGDALPDDWSAPQPHREEVSLSLQRTLLTGFQAAAIRCPRWPFVRAAAIGLGAAALRETRGAGKPGARESGCERNHSSRLTLGPRHPSSSRVPHSQFWLFSRPGSLRGLGKWGSQSPALHSFCLAPVAQGSEGRMKCHSLG